MSQNYPDRKKWLSVRATPRRMNRWRMKFISTNYAWVPADPTNLAGPSHFAKVSRGNTLRLSDLSPEQAAAWKGVR